jgi:Spy/CpxP family protein refolding chaperone
MKTRRTILTSACAVLLLAGAALAQGHGAARTGMVNHLASALSLTEAQKATATELEKALQTAAAPLLQQSRQQWAEIRALLDGANPDATEIGEKMIAAHATQTQIKALHDQFDAKLATILSAEQKAKLGELQQMRRGRELDHPGPPGPGF